MFTMEITILHTKRNTTGSKKLQKKLLKIEQHF